MVPKAGSIDITPEERDAILRNDFLSFFRKAFAELHPGQEIEDNWHLEAIAHQLERARKGEIKRLIINAPPRSLKSLMSVVAFSAYVIGKDPGKSIVCASYSQDLSTKHSSDFRRVMDSDWFQRLFRTAAPLKSTETEYKTAKGGARYSTSVGGTVTGFGADIIIIDDPLNAVDANSDAALQRHRDWYSGALVSRLNNKQTGVIICVMQRLHPEDLTGYLLEQGGWEVLDLPAIAPEDREVALLTDPITNLSRSYKWHEGESLQAAREPLFVLDQLKRQIGTDKFSAQYLQQPVSAAGNMLKAEWLRTYEFQPSKQAHDKIVQSWDTAMKAADMNDYSACLTFLVRNHNEYYLVDVYRQRLEFPDLSKFVISHAKQFQADTILIEDKASGTPLIQNVKHAGLQAVIGINPSKDKKTRMYEQTPKLEARSLIVPLSAPWLSDFKTEYLAFPSSKYDDQIDALSQFLEWQVNRDNNLFEVDWGNDEDGSPSPESILSLVGK